MVRLSNKFHKIFIKAKHSLVHFPLTFNKHFCLSFWNLQSWNNQQFCTKSQSTHRCKREPSTNTHNRFTSPSNLCLLADSRPLFVSSPLSWGVGVPCCYFCITRSVAGQDIGWMWGREKGTRGRSGGEVTCSESRTCQITILENADLFICISAPFFHFMHSFLQQSHHGGQNFWWPVSAEVFIRGITINSADT